MEAKTRAAAPAAVGRRTANGSMRRAGSGSTTKPGASEQGRWSADVPAGTTLQIQTRSGDTTEPDRTWSVWSLVYGDPNGDIRTRSAFRDRWIVDEAKMQRTNDALFMHCLPVRRNVIVTDWVIDSANSVVIDEAENRLHIQKAIMSELIK